MQIETPSKKNAGNVPSFFSGHYQCYGINIQAVCDSNCIFTYFALSGPGSMNDRAAIKEYIPNIGSLYNTIETLPQNYVVIGDPAYEATEHLVPNFYGVSRQTSVANDNYNWAASCC
jgi:hypothetical protein